MKKLFWLCVSLLLAARLPAQSNAPARLAIIAESPDASALSDILTAELSKNSQIALLERNEIDKVFREQGLSAENRDYLKLGQVLGADGLLLLDSIANTNQPVSSLAPPPPNDLTARFIAVRPGVLLVSERITWPGDISQWAAGFATHLQPLFPKLSVLVQDAVPISIENLRSTVQSPASRDLEHQLTALTIERLTRERQLFVLERRKMQLLTSEKNLKGLDDSPFWNGSFLLDGTIDRNGYSETEVTISGRLVPPKGGTPVDFEVSGNRTNLAAVVDQFARKIAENLKLSSTPVAWNPADEARAYFDEAKWALRWGIYDEAQAASESAWALGKQDMDCALTRMESYRREIPPVLGPGMEQRLISGKKISISVDDPPDPEDLNQALNLLRLYDDFGRTLPEPPKLDSPYYLLGCDVLEKATGVLRHFHYNPDSQQPVSDKLADLRTLARSIATWLSQAPSVRDTYWLDDRIPSGDEVYQNFSEYRSFAYRKRQNLFDYELQWGCYWQERPEDCLALYRKLMSNPLFVCIHQSFWFRSADDPRLIAWTAEDRARLPQVWTNFLTELQGSTNAFWGMEARAVEFADAGSEREKFNSDVVHTDIYRRRASIKEMKEYQAQCDQNMEETGTNLFDFVMANYEQIVSGRDELFFLGWGLGGFFGRSGVVTDTKERLESEYRNTFAPRLSALQNNGANRYSEHMKEIEHLQKFEKQKQYLASFTPFDLAEFGRLFSSQDAYSKQQAVELESLAERYASNTVATTVGFENFKAKSNVQWIEFTLEKKLKETINAPQPMSAPVTASATPPPALKVAVATNVPVPEISAPTNILIARNFLRIPKEELAASNLLSTAVFGHRLRDDTLLLALQYEEQWWENTTNSRRQRNLTSEAVAIHRYNGAWEIIQSPHVENTAFGFIAASVGAPTPTSFIELFKNHIYISDLDAIRAYDLKTRQWHELPFSGQTRAQLFAIGDHLYATSSESIVEILDDGRSAHILASTRRRPARSVLDTRDNLKDPVLFAGPDGSLCASLEGDVFSWTDGDWKPVFNVSKSWGTEVFDGTVLFRSSPQRQEQEFWKYASTEKDPVLCWREDRARSSGVIYSTPLKPVEQTTSPLWKQVSGLSLAYAPVVMDGSNLYFFTSDTGRSGRSLGERNGHHGDLICLLPGNPKPVKVPVKFDPAYGPIPDVPSMRTHWMECSSEFLFIGQGTMPGVWAVPKSEIRAEIDRQTSLRTHAPAP